MVSYVTEKLRYSFMGGRYSNCTKEEMLELMNTTSKPFKYTYGLGYRNPTTNHVPITREKAIAYLNSNGLTDVTEEEDYIHVNQYSDNDMW